MVSPNFKVKEFTTIFDLMSEQFLYLQYSRLNSRSNKFPLSLNLNGHKRFVTSGIQNKKIYKERGKWLLLKFFLTYEIYSIYRDAENSVLSMG